MPAAHVGVADEEDTAVRIDGDAAHPKRQAAAPAPRKVGETPEGRVERGLDGGSI
jgi:hypothetical protein